MPFTYETHLHTEQGSLCGAIPGREHIARYKALGYAGVFITDHFFGGNCRPDRALDWAEWVRQWSAGYEDAKQEGDKQGLQVLFGLEQRFEWDEWLVYGLDKAYLLAHPDIVDWPRGLWLKNVRAAGGCCVQAHPFRDRAYITRISPCIGVDGMEIANAGNQPAFDLIAARCAAAHGLFGSAGSDLHRVDQHPDEALMGVTFDSPLRDVYDYAAAVREKRAHTLRIPAGRVDFLGDEAPSGEKPVQVFGTDGALVAADRPLDILFG